MNCFLVKNLIVSNNDSIIDILTLQCFFGPYWAKRKLASCLFKKKANEFSCLFGQYYF